MSPSSISSHIYTWFPHPHPQILRGTPAFGRRTRGPVVACLRREMVSRGPRVPCNVTLHMRVMLCHCDGAAWENCASAQHYISFLPLHNAFLINCSLRYEHRLRAIQTDVTGTPGPTRLIQEPVAFTNYDLSRYNDYPDSDFTWYSSVTSKKKCITSHILRTLPSKPFLINSLLVLA